jgi:hypothetical protein
MRQFYVDSSAGLGSINCRRRRELGKSLEQMTIKLSPQVRALILDDVYRRKRDRLPNSSIHALITERVAEKIGKKAYPCVEHSTFTLRASVDTWFLSGL